MCSAALQRIVEVLGDRVVAVDVHGARHRISLLALEGPSPPVGTWLVVHSGYAIGRLEQADATAVLHELGLAGVLHHDEPTSDALAQMHPPGAKGGGDARS